MEKGDADLCRTCSKLVWRIFGALFWGRHIQCLEYIVVGFHVVGWYVGCFPDRGGVGVGIRRICQLLQCTEGDPVTLFGGVFLIVLAIVFNGIASGKVSEVSGQTVRKRGVLIAVCAGILMAFFYRFVAAAIDLENLESPAVGMMTPYSALFVFAIGIFISNFLFNSLLMRKPFTGCLWLTVNTSKEI